MVVPRPSFASHQLRLLLFFFFLLHFSSKSFKSNFWNNFRQIYPHSPFHLPVSSAKDVLCWWLLMAVEVGAGLCCWIPWISNTSLRQSAHVSPPYLEGKCLISVPLRLGKLSFVSALLRFQSVLEIFKFCLPSYLSK